MLGAELTAHLGYEEGKDAPPVQANRRNGASVKVLKGLKTEVTFKPSITIVIWVPNAA